MFSVLFVLFIMFCAIYICPIVSIVVNSIVIAINIIFVSVLFNVSFSVSLLNFDNAIYVINIAIASPSIPRIMILFVFIFV